ncbi:hypothetical protein ACWGQ9_03210 [Streptomyces parvus]
MIIGLGGNDLAAPKLDNPCMGSAPVVSAHQIISAHKELIRAAHARGIKAVGATRRISRHRTKRSQPRRRRHGKVNPESDTDELHLMMSGKHDTLWRKANDLL